MLPLSRWGSGPLLLRFGLRQQVIRDSISSFHLVRRICVRVGHKLIDTAFVEDLGSQASHNTRTSSGFG